MFLVNNAIDVRGEESNILHTTVLVHAITKKDRELLHLNRVKDALDLMNEFEQGVNSSGQINVQWLTNMLRSMKSYDPNNK